MGHEEQEVQATFLLLLLPGAVALAVVAQILQQLYQPQQQE